MAKNFGSSGASSIIRAATAAANKVNAYNDAAAAYEYDISEKTQADADKYNAYLSKRIDQTKNADPTKALSLQRTATSAYRSFNSAEIQRATTAVKYGDITNRDKYNQLNRLQQAAVANGDANLAQNLNSQMASLSVQIQNEDLASTVHGDVLQRKQEAANRRAVDQAVNDLDTHVKIAKDLSEQGKLSVQDYQRIAAEAGMTKQDLLQKAGSGQIAGLDDNAIADFNTRSTEYGASDEFKKLVALGQNAKNGSSSQYISVDPGLHNNDGTNFSTLKNLPGEINAVDKNGNIVKQYAGGFQDYNQTSGANGTVTNTATGTLADRQKKVEGGQFEYIFPQVGTGDAAHIASPAGGKPIKDAKGNYFVVDQNGNKHYINLDPNALLQRSQEPIDPNAQPFGPTSIWGQIGQNFKDTAKTVADVFKGRGSLQPKTGAFRIASTGGLFGGLLNNLVTRNNTAQIEKQRQIELQRARDQHAAFLASEQARVAAENAKNAKLLPVFQKPPAPTPTPAGQLPQLSPLPGQPGYVAPVAKAKEVIKNPKSTAFDAIEALRGGLF